MAGGPNECLKKNMEALETGGQTLALDWLRKAEGGAVEEVSAESGEAVLVVSGQSQASRRDPNAEARKWLERQRGLYGAAGGNETLCLFGFGNPGVAELLLLEKGPLAVFEPNPQVVRHVLSGRDFSRALAEARLSVLTPWHAADGRLDSLAGALVLVHPPAQRREAAQLEGLRKILAGGERDLRGLNGREPRLMIIPPLSGGSWPVAVSLAGAAEAGGHPTLFLDWDKSLKQRETAAHRARGAGQDRLLAGLFADAARAAAVAATAFEPDLIIALAQAPLDAAGLAAIREACGAALAFWLVEDVRHFGYAAGVAPFYDAFFHIQAGFIEPILRSWGLRRAWYLPLAADSGLFRPKPEAGGYAAALSFMGAAYPNRRQLMERLAREYWPHLRRPADDFKVFGSGWGGVSPALAQHLFEGGRRVSQAECAMIYAGGLVNLNIHSSFAAEPGFDPSSAFVNPRTFEIASAASLQLVDARPLLPPLFENERELITVEKPDQLPELIDHYLSRPEDAAEIGRAGRARVLREHTYQHRLARLLRLLGWKEGT